MVVSLPLPADLVQLMISLYVVSKTNFEFHWQNDRDGLIIIADTLYQPEFKRLSGLTSVLLRCLSSVAAYTPMSSGDFLSLGHKYRL